MEIEIGYVSDTGRKRHTNEDYIALWEPDSSEAFADVGSLYVLADGVGGTAAGEVASRYAAEKVVHDYFAGHKLDPNEGLLAAIQAANREIYTYNQAHLEQREMGTTLVAALIRGKVLLIGNVGDSRAYLVREAMSLQLTRDHSIVARMLYEGEITAEEAANHPWRNRLTRCLGLDSDVAVDLFTYELQENDVVILCSDGLTRHVDDGEITQLATQREPQVAARDLVQLANSRGGTDNISVVVLRVAAGRGRRRRKRKRRSLPDPELDTTFYTVAQKKRWRWPFSRR